MLSLNPRFGNCAQQTHGSPTPRCARALFFRAGHLFDDGEDSGHQRNCQQNEWRFFGFINVDPFVIVYLDRIITVGNELEIKILRFREIVLPAWILRSSTHE